MPDKLTGVYEYALEAEPSLIGCLLREPPSYSEVSQIVRADDFIDPECRAVFLALKSLTEAGEPTDPVSIHRRTAGAADAKHLAVWLNLCVSTANATALAKRVREDSIRRQLGVIGHALTEASIVPADPSCAISEARAALEGIEEESTSQPILSPLESSLQFWEHRGKVSEGVAAFVKTGLPALDEMLGGGMLNSGFYVLAARPGVGKTALALTICDSVAESGGAVLFISLEMDAVQLMARRVAREAGVNSSQLLMGEIPPEKEDEVTAAEKRLSERPLYINGRESASVDDIAQMARKIKNLRLVCIDYLGLIKMDSRRGRYEATTDVSNRLKALARKLQIPILCLAQLNRAAEGRKDPRPLLSDLRDTGAIEQDADSVMFLHPMAAEDENRKPWEPVGVELIVAKNRHAGRGKIPLAFYPGVMRFKQGRYE